MAVSIGATSERWLQGVDRLVIAMADAMPAFRRPASRADRIPARWVMERGAVIASAPVNVLGGFPGSLRAMNRLVAASLLITDRYLVVGEGTPDGFALPIGRILAVARVRPSAHANPGLVIHYQDGPGVGTFGLDFRGIARGRSGRCRADDAFAALREAGVRPFRAQHLARSPRLAMTWQQAQAHAGEDLVWSGTAIGSIGGWFGMQQSGCRIWLTAESLFWTCATADGVNRMPVASIIEARDGVGDRILVSMRDHAGHRYDLAFDLAVDGQLNAGREQRTRLLNALASLGIAVGAAARPFAPWRRGGMLPPSDR
jgi:hypothetical protein